MNTSAEDDRAIGALCLMVGESVREAMIRAGCDGAAVERVLGEVLDDIPASWGIAALASRDAIEITTRLAADEYGPRNCVIIRKRRGI